MSSPVSSPQFSQSTKFFTSSPRLLPGTPRSLSCADAHRLCQCRLKCSTVVSLFAVARGLSGSGNHGDDVRPELLEVSQPPGHHRSNCKNVSGSMRLLCQVGYSPLTNVKEMCHSHMALSPSHNALGKNYHFLNWDYFAEIKSMKL